MQNTTAATVFAPTFKMDQALARTENCSALLLETLEGEPVADDVSLEVAVVSVDEARLLGAAEGVALQILREYGTCWGRQNSYVRNRIVWQHVVALTPYVVGASSLDVAAAITDALEALGLE